MHITMCINSLFKFKTQNDDLGVVLFTKDALKIQIPLFSKYRTYTHLLFAISILYLINYYLIYIFLIFLSFSIQNTLM